jgi:hypothetical protein
MGKVLTTEEYQAIGKKFVQIVLTDDDNSYYSVYECNAQNEIFGKPLSDGFSSLDDCLNLVKGNGWYLINMSQLRKINWTTIKKDEIETILIDMWNSIGMDTPSNFEDIVQDCYEDVCETADPETWHSGDVAIAFRRWIESQANKD